jgi:hypothetical protein
VPQPRAGSLVGALGVRRAHPPTTTVSPFELVAYSYLFCYGKSCDRSTLVRSRRSRGPAEGELGPSRSSERRRPIWRARGGSGERYDIKDQARGRGEVRGRLCHDCESHVRQCATEQESLESRLAQAEVKVEGLRAAVTTANEAAERATVVASTAETVPETPPRRRQCSRQRWRSCSKTWSPPERTLAQPTSNSLK